MFLLIFWRPIVLIIIFSQRGNAISTQVYGENSLTGNPSKEKKINQWKIKLIKISSIAKDKLS